ncbi:argininosuccinate lyase [compost metagenome]
MDLKQMKQFSDLIESDVYKCLDIRECVARRKIPGGPAPETMQKALQEAAEWIARMKNGDE